LSKILPSSGLGRGPKRLKTTALMTSLTKNQIPKTIFIVDLKTCWAFWRFQQISSTIDRGDMPLLRHVKTSWF